MTSRRSLSSSRANGRCRFACATFALLFFASACQSFPTGEEDADGPVLAPVPPTNPEPPQPNQAEIALETDTKVFRRSNPGGGGAFSTSAISPDGSTWLVGTDLSGLVRSLDDGASWAMVGATQGLTDTHVASIAFAPNDGSVVFLGADDGLFRSVDGGASFERLEPRGYVGGLGVSGDVVLANAQTSFDSDSATLFRSLDGGDSFEAITAPAPNRFIVAFRFDPDDEQHLLAITGEGRFVQTPKELYESFDLGSTWQRLDPGGPVVDAQFDPAEPGEILVAIDEGADGDGALVRSSDGGWTAVADRGGVLWVSPDQPVRIIDPRFQFPWDDRNGTWQLAADGGAFERTGSVETWTTGWTGTYYAHGGGFNGEVPTLSFDPADPDHALWVNGQWIYETTDGGTTFHQLTSVQLESGWQSRGADNVVVNDLAVGAEPEVLYAAYWDIGCFRSLDAGRSWENCNTVRHSGSWDGFGSFVGTIAADPERPDVVWSSHSELWHQPAALLRSEERGASESWQDTTGIPSVRHILGLSVDPTSPTADRTLYVTAGGDVYRSVDDGRSWELDHPCPSVGPRESNGGGCRGTFVDPAGNTFAFGESGLWRRVDGSWIPQGDGRLVGESGGPPWTRGWGGVAAVSGTADGVLWAGVTGAGIFASSDGGATFELVVEDPHVRDLVVHPDDPDSVWAGSSSAYNSGGFSETSSGLRRTLDGGSSWETVDIGVPWPFVTNLAIAENAVIVGSPGAGVVLGSDGSATP